jgi:hypothetical protein
MTMVNVDLVAVSFAISITSREGVRGSALKSSFLQEAQMAI